jgi:hypothetical protein
MLLRNNQTAYTPFIGEYASTAYLISGSGICLIATYYYSGVSARLRDSRTTSLSKSDYG